MTTTPTSDAVKRVRVGLLGAFCVYHMAASLFANMPTSTAFGEELRAPFERYIDYTGLKQSWTMFDTIPYFRSIHPVLVARYPSGREQEFGAMLPGLTPYRPRTRLAALFVRFTWPSGDTGWFARGYLERACTAVWRSGGPGAERPSSMGLRLDAQRLVPLAEVRRTGSMSSAAHEFSPVTASCE
jgi:hypothetical protein